MKRFVLYVLLAVLYVGVLLLFYVPTPVKTVEEQGTVELYSCRLVNCSALLIGLLNQSQESRCAFYDLGEQALIEYFMQSRTVDLLIYEENYESWFGDGISPVGSKGLMHHKFCIFDDEAVLTGTWNPTIRGTYKNDNVVVLVRSQTIAHVYEEEHFRLQEKKFSDREILVDFGGVVVKPCMSRWQDCQQMILDEIEEAQNYIRVLAFSFTDGEIAEALVAAHERGVTVEVIFEKTRIAQYSVYDELEEKGVVVLLDGNPSTMHEKVFLIDDDVVVVGSYNPTKNARERNDENLLVVESEAFAADMNREYERIRCEVTE